MKLRAFQLLLALAFATSSSLIAQTGLATISGTVTDQTGAVIAGVNVSATQLATGTTVLAATSETGNYTIPQLRVGEYEVTVEQSGFKTFKRSGITLAAAQILRLDIQLEVGATTESVTVTAEASLLKTESGTLVQNITPERIRNLPLLPVGTFIRDPFALSNTLPGVLQNFIATRINGLGQNTIQYRLDGEVLGQVNFAGITTRTQPSPDAVEEVSVQTSNIAAEFGSASGGVYNVSIKSGTNSFHGTVYDYAVNEVLNSADPANHQRNRVRRHNYGFNIGGPVKIPWLYDGTNKTFFFFNWEQYRDTQRQTTFTYPTVPTQAYRDGDFSGLFNTTQNANLRLNAGGSVRDYRDPLGNTVRLGTIYDPRSTTTVVCNTAVSQDCGTNGNQLNMRTPFPGNRVPTTLFDPVAVAVLTKYVPLPNQGGALINNYFNPFTSSRITSSPALKADQNLGSKGRLSFTFTRNKTDSAVQALGGLAEGFPSVISRNTGTFEDGPSFRLNFDYTIRPTLNYHLGLGYSIFSFNTRPLDTDYNAVTDIGLRGARANKNFPLLNLGADTNPANGGLNTLGTQGQTGFAERRPSISQNLTWVNGNHTIKFGGEFRQDMLPNFGFGGANGSYGFNNLNRGITWNPALLNVVGFSGQSNIGFTFANFLMGGVTNVSLSTPVVYRRSKQQWGFFVQDNWRIRRNLTIDAGLRYDYGTYTSEDYGRLGALSLSQPNSAAAGHPGGVIFESTCKCNFAQNYPYAIGPRVGIAYTINPKTVIRGGVGLAYNSTGTAASGSVTNSTSLTVQNPGDAAFYLRDGIPASVNPQWPVFDSGIGMVPGTVANAPPIIDQNAGRPDRTFQWNVSLQREITRDLVVEASYVGNRNVWAATGGFYDFNAVSQQLLAQYNFTVGNAADNTLLNSTLQNANASQLAQKGVFLPYSNFPRTATVFQSIRPYPQYSSGISPAGAMGKSWYDALQLMATKRFSHGLQGTINYTFSKNLQWNGPVDVFNPTTGKDLVGANPPQVLRIAFEYQIPKPSPTIPVLSNNIVSWAVRDWAVSSALFYQTAGYIGRPNNLSSNPISRWLGRGTGQAQLKKNADGSYMNPWSVNWTDLDGKKRTDPLDINCHCFDPRTTAVLNPLAWENVPDGQWAAQTQILPFFRGARRPSESFNVARNIRMGPDGRYVLQVRVEFQNIFNRKFVPNPTLGNYQTAPGPVLGSVVNGQVVTAYNTGFGTFGNQLNAGTYGTPRSGQFIARFSF